MFIFCKFYDQQHLLPVVVVSISVQPQRKVRDQTLKQENEIRVLIYAYPHDNIKGVDVPRRYVTAATCAFRTHDLCEVISIRISKM